MKIIIIITLSLVFVLPVSAQNWDWMLDVVWDNPPNSFLGYSNPSYSQQDSLLYFDTFYRGIPAEGFIYTSKLDSINQYNLLEFSDPLLLPAPINIPGSINCMPSINHAGDSMFFSSNRPCSYGGFDIYLSVKSNNEWSDPINLGDSVNSISDDFSPCYSPLYQRFFFDRYIGNDLSLIYSCEYLGSNIWSEAVPLPPIINSEGDNNISPYFNENESALYFTIQDYEFTPDPILKSYLSGENWSNPVPLSYNVNGFYLNEPTACNLVLTEHPSISQDSSIIFYNKHLWQISACIDVYSILFYSFALPVDIQDSKEITPSLFDISAYPNPFNSSCKITVSDPEIEQVSIYDITGAVVKMVDLVNGQAVWDASGYSAGVYLAKVEHDGYLKTVKLVFLK